MAAPTFKRRELLNRRTYFIPAGEIVDGVTVSATTWPDNDPLTNWTNYEFPDVEKVNEVHEYTEEERQIPRTTGGYVKDVEKTLVSSKSTISTAKTNSYIKQLEKCLATAPVVNQPQTPGLAASDYIEGVLLMETQAKAGAMVDREQTWARMRLATVPEIGPATRVFDIEFEHRDAGNNTFVQLS